MDFLHNSLQLIEQYMLAYGYWAVFFGVMLENAGVPVPGETILLIAGYFAASRSDQFNIIRVMITAATGAVVGDNIGFAIGHHYGRGILLRFGRFIFLTPKRLENMEKYFQSHGNKTILVARFITGLLITTLGYLFGQSLPLLVKWVGRSGTILLIVAIVIAVIVWRIRRHRIKARSK